MCIAVSLALVAQVNPHVAPFYAHLRGRPGRPSGGRARTGAWRGGFLLGALEVSIKEDLKKQLRTLQAHTHACIHNKLRKQLRTYRHVASACRHAASACRHAASACRHASITYGRRCSLTGSSSAATGRTCGCSSRMPSSG